MGLGEGFLLYLNPRHIGLNYSISHSVYGQTCIHIHSL